MDKRLPIEDDSPWYRQFWPWFLIMLPASVVVAGLSTLYIANRHADDLVVDEYYKDGLAINRQLEKRERARNLGITASLDFGDQQVTVQLAGDTDSPELLLLMSHPLESDQDFVVALAQTDAGHYLGQLPRDVAARWHWTLESVGDEPWRLDGSVSAGDINDDVR